MGEGFSAGGFCSDCTEPEAVALTPPGVAGWSAVGFGSLPGGGEGGDFGSSGMVLRDWTLRASRRQKNVNFYQLDDTVSTRLVLENF
jgi:hypothetical protein